MPASPRAPPARTRSPQRSRATRATEARPSEPDLELVERLASELDCPVLAEGRYSTPDDVAAAFGAGAFAVVVGTAITDPIALTRRLAEAAARSRSHGAPR